jgi:H+/Cl- antiporter ClcA
MRKQISNFTDYFRIATFIAKWTVWVSPIAVVSGTASAFFLWALDKATVYRWQNDWLLYGLPFAGVGIVFLYQKLGKNADQGNNLIMDEIHLPGGGVPARMAPFVLVTSLLTHLFGGSAGREGTAVQMGGSTAALLGRAWKLSSVDLSLLLMAGMAAGFGSVFGTPVAGAIFALEVLTIGQMQYVAVVPCLIAAVIGNATCAAWGVEHTHYHISFSSTSMPVFSVKYGFLLLKVGIAGVLFGLVAQAFVALNHFLQDSYKKYLPSPYLKPLIGGGVIIGLVHLLGTSDYLGLGVKSPQAGGVSILNAFHAGGAGPLSWFWKLLFTAITLSSGFKGGEVTPLFFIGACLGNTLAILLGSPIDLFAALGFIAVFAGATNTPIACMVMGIELFGSENILFFAVACFIAYFFSGQAGIYKSQRGEVSKMGGISMKEPQLLPENERK